MRILVGALMLIPFFASAGNGRKALPEPSEKIQRYLSLYLHADNSSAVSEEVFSFVGKLQNKQTSFKDRGEFLEYVFNKTHQRFLKNFVEYASFGDLLNKGSYNCLTGTALYALILDHFDVSYQVIETNYHIFLLAQTGSGSVLFEATDPTNGFVSDSKEIEKRIEGYRQNAIQKAETSKTFYRYNFELYNEVNLDEMLGLLHYNLSIAAYNQHNLSLSIDHLGKAMELYQSPRIEEFSRIILLSVVEGNLDPAEKEKCVENIRALLKKHLVITASKN